MQGLLGAINAGLHAKQRSMSASRPLLQTQAARRQQEGRLADALVAVAAAQSVAQGAPELALPDQPPSCISSLLDNLQTTDTTVDAWCPGPYLFH